VFVCFADIYVDCLLMSLKCCVDKMSTCFGCRLFCTIPHYSVTIMYCVCEMATANKPAILFHNKSLMLRVCLCAVVIVLQCASVCVWCSVVCLSVSVVHACVCVACARVYVHVYGVMWYTCLLFCLCCVTV